MPDDDIEARLRKVREELASFEKIDLADSEVADRTKKMSDEIGEVAQSSRFPDAPQIDVPLKDDPRKLQAARKAEAASYHGIASGMQIAYIIVGMPALGLGIGWLVDRGTGGNVGQGLGTVIGMTAGVILAIRLSSHPSSRK